MTTLAVSAKPLRSCLSHGKKRQRPIGSTNIRFPEQQEELTTVKKIAPVPLLVGPEAKGDLWYNRKDITAFRQATETDALDIIQKQQITRESWLALTAVYQQCIQQQNIKDLSVTLNEQHQKYLLKMFLTCPQVVGLEYMIMGKRNDRFMRLEEIFHILEIQSKETKRSQAKSQSQDKSIDMNASLNLDEVFSSPPSSPGKTHQESNNHGASASAPTSTSASASSSSLQQKARKIIQITTPSQHFATLLAQQNSASVLALWDEQEKELPQLQRNPKIPDQQMLGYATNSMHSQQSSSSSKKRIKSALRDPLSKRSNKQASVSIADIDKNQVVPCRAADLDELDPAKLWYARDEIAQLQDDFDLSHFALLRSKVVTYADIQLLSSFYEACAENNHDNSAFQQLQAGLVKLFFHCGPTLAGLEFVLMGNRKEAQQERLKALHEAIRQSTASFSSKDGESTLLLQVACQQITFSQQQFAIHLAKAHATAALLVHAMEQKQQLQPMASRPLTTQKPAVASLDTVNETSVATNGDASMRQKTEKRTNQAPDAAEEESESESFHLDASGDSESFHLDTSGAFEESIHNDEDIEFQAAAVALHESFSMSYDDDDIFGSQDDTSESFCEALELEDQAAQWLAKRDELRDNESEATEEVSALFAAKEAHGDAVAAPSSPQQEAKFSSSLHIALSSSFRLDDDGEGAVEKWLHNSQSSARWNIDLNDLNGDVGDDDEKEKDATREPVPSDADATMKPNNGDSSSKPPKSPEKNNEVSEKVDMSTVKEVPPTRSSEDALLAKGKNSEMDSSTHSELSNPGRKASLWLQRFEDLQNGSWRENDFNSVIEDSRRSGPNPPVESMEIKIEKGSPSSKQKSKSKSKSSKKKSKDTESSNATDSQSFPENESKKGQKTRSKAKTGPVGDVKDDIVQPPLRDNKPDTVTRQKKGRSMSLTSSSPEEIQPHMEDASLEKKAKSSRRTRSQCVETNKVRRTKSSDDLENMQKISRKVSRSQSSDGLESISKMARKMNKSKSSDGLQDNKKMPRSITRSKSADNLEMMTKSRQRNDSMEPTKRGSRRPKKRSESVTPRRSSVGDPTETSAFRRAKRSSSSSRARSVSVKRASRRSSVDSAVSSASRGRSLSTSRHSRRSSVDSADTTADNPRTTSRSRRSRRPSLDPALASSDSKPKKSKKKEPKESSGKSKRNGNEGKSKKSSRSKISKEVAAEQ